MRIGIRLAHVGPHAGPDSIRTSARAAESLGYDSVWVLDRLLAPLEPRSGYGGIEGLALPAEQATCVDPFATLAFAAASTERVRLGANVLRDTAAGFGRNPDVLQLVVRANIYLYDRPVEGARLSYMGNVEQAADDLLATKAAGAHEVLHLHGDMTPEGYAALADGLDRPAAPRDGQLHERPWMAA